MVGLNPRGWVLPRGGEGPNKPQQYLDGGQIVRSGVGSTSNVICRRRGGAADEQIENDETGRTSKIGNKNKRAFQNAA